MTRASAAIVPAAGSGQRLVNPAALAADGQRPKALRMLAGRTMVHRCVEQLLHAVDYVVVAAPTAHVEAVRADLSPLGSRVQTVGGGPTRQRSVAAALTALDDALDLVLVHDAARPLVPVDVIRRVLDFLVGGAAAVVPVVDVADSLRHRSGGEAKGPLDRSTVCAVQTPQGFQRAVLERAHAAAADAEATDDATLVERLGYALTLVEGDPRAFKITTPLDLLLAEAVIADQR
ncbi:MAG: 2-C-methyl-D-erythritol 4-phosphate cytidylyltransferase [Nocardioidaceae bacterium]